MKIFNDLLKTIDPNKEGSTSKYSQSRVYLLITFLLILVMTVSSWWMPEENTNFQFALDTLFWTFLTLSSYALVSKGFQHHQIVQIAKARTNVSDNIKKKVEEVKNDLNNQELS